jgi:serine/threonine protein kinase
MTDSQTDAGPRLESIRLPGGWRAHVAVRSPTPAQDWQRVLPTLLPKLLKPNESQLLKYSASGWVQRMSLDFPSGPIEVICKHSRPKTLIRKMLSLLRGPRELGQWRQAQWLMQAGVRTARPLALLIRRANLLRPEGYMITEYIEASEELYWTLERDRPRLDPRQRWRSMDGLTRAVAEVFARLHENRLSHRDLKATNFLLTGGLGSAHDPLVWLVDLDGLAQVASPSDDVLIRQVARLAASLGRAPTLTRTEQLRFLKRVLADCRMDAGRWRQYGKAIASVREKHLNELPATT